MSRHKKDFHQLMDKAREAGWNIIKCNGGHWRWTHPSFAKPMFTADTPSDHRAIKNVESFIRRAERQAA